MVLVVDFQLGMLESSAIPLVRDGEALKIICSLVWDAREAGVPVVFGHHDRGPGHPLEGGNEEWRIRPDVALLYGEPVVRNRPTLSTVRRCKRPLDERGADGSVLAGLTTEY